LIFTSAAVLPESNLYNGEKRQPVYYNVTIKHVCATIVVGE